MITANHFAQIAADVDAQRAAQEQEGATLRQRQQGALTELKTLVTAYAPVIDFIQFCSDKIREKSTALKQETTSEADPLKPLFKLSCRWSYFLGDADFCCEYPRQASFSISAGSFRVSNNLLRSVTEKYPNFRQSDEYAGAISGKHQIADVKRVLDAIVKAVAENFPANQNLVDDVAVKANNAYEQMQLNLLPYLPPAPPLPPPTFFQRMRRYLPFGGG